jgi:hypothetical protein
MHRLLEQIRTPEFENAHPAAQASYLHYAFVAIHPFADGNGRVARALASVYFYRAHSIPFLVFANQKNAYLDALRQADLGQRQDLVAFFLNRGVDTVQLVVEHLLAAEAPSPANVAARLRLNDEVALKLLEAAREEIRRQFSKLDLPIYFDLDVETTDNVYWGFGEDYRQVMGDHSLDVIIENFELKRTSEKNVTVLIARDRTDPFPFCLLEGRGDGDELEIRFEDVHPDISKSLQLRLDSWCRRLLGRMLQELEDGPANAGE